MKDTHIDSLHGFLRAGILLGFSVFITFLIRDDSIFLYIAPRMIIYVQCAALLLYFLGVVQVYQAITTLWGKATHCNCDHAPSKSVLLNLVVYGLFVTPLLFGFMLPNATMGSSMASIKGVQLNAATTMRLGDIRVISPEGAEHIRANTLQPLRELPDSDLSPEDQSSSRVDSSLNSDQELDIPVDEDYFLWEDHDEEFFWSPDPEEERRMREAELLQQPPVENPEIRKLFTSTDFDGPFMELAMKLYLQDVIDIDEALFTEILTSIDLYLERFIGKTIRVRGFVHREQDLKADQFVIARFAIQCCAADGAPYGIMVEAKETAEYDTDQWVEITGTLQTTTYLGMEIMSLIPDQIERIPEPSPSDSYVYPNYYFF